MRDGSDPGGRHTFLQTDRDRTHHNLDAGECLAVGGSGVSIGTGGSTTMAANSIAFSGSGNTSLPSAPVFVRKTGG